MGKNLFSIKTCKKNKKKISAYPKLYFESKVAEESYCVLEKYICNHIQNSDDFFYHLGYEVLGPILFGLCEWIEKNTTENPIFFLAREGKLIQKAYKALTNNEGEYLYVSRHSVNVPLFCLAHSFEEFLCYKIDTLRKNCTVEEYMYYCGISDKNASSSSLNPNMYVKKTVDSLSDEKKIYKCLKDLINLNSMQQKDYLIKYLNEIRFTGDVVIVDVGWSGSVQHCLKELEKSTDELNYTIKGLYCGVRNTESNNQIHNLYRKGYFFNDERENEIGMIIRFTLSLFEMLFMPCSGTTKGYFCSDKKTIEPIIDDPENNIGIAGKIICVQDAAIQFINDMKNYTEVKDILQNPRIAFENYKMFAYCPPPRVLKEFYGFQVDDGLKYCILSDKSIGYYLLHMNSFIRDFQNNRCKEWFLQSIIALPFSYIPLLSGFQRLRNFIGRITQRL